MNAELTEEQIDRLRLVAFKSNAYDDRQAYFEAASKWFQRRHYRADAAELLQALKRCEAMVSTDQGPPNWDWVREVISKAEASL